MKSFCVLCKSDFDFEKKLGFIPDKCRPCYKSFNDAHPLIEKECTICHIFFKARKAERKTCYECAKAYVTKMGY